MHTLGTLVLALQVQEGAPALSETGTIAGLSPINLVVLGGTLNWSLAAVTIGAEIFFVYLARQMHGSKIEEIMHQAEKDQLIN